MTDTREQVTTASTSQEPQSAAGLTPTSADSSTTRGTTDERPMPHRIWVFRGDARFPEDDTWTDTPQPGWAQYVLVEKPCTFPACDCPPGPSACGRSA
jgi:hypothetical protein